MSDSFIHNHQAALDSQMEDNAIKDLEDAGIYPVPDNDDILEKLYEKWEIISCENKVGEYELSYEGECTHETFDTEDEAKLAIKSYVKEEFEELPEPGDYDD